MQDFDKKIRALPDGSYDVTFNEKRYLLSKKTQLDGKLIKLYAKELAANDFISLNYYPKIKGGLLKPCEMPQEKVIDFILRMKVNEPVKD